jgi:hypothetical protein
MRLATIAGCFDLSLSRSKSSACFPGVKLTSVPGGYTDAQAISFRYPARP